MKIILISLILIFDIFIGTLRGEVGELPQQVSDTTEVKLIDIDKDGDLDALFTNDRKQNWLYINNGKGIFKDETTLRLPPDKDWSIDVDAADVDKDEDFDLIIGNNGRNKLYINDGKGFFSDDSEKRLPEDKDWTHDVDFCDIDNDGDFDILVGNVQAQNRIYINDSKGFFVDKTNEIFPEIPDDFTHAIECGDMDGDRYKDIYIANLGSQNYLWKNEKGVKFIDVTKSNLPKKYNWSIDTEFADIDSDGDLDIITANFKQESFIFINDGKGKFEKSSLAKSENGGISKFDKSIDVDAFDINKDGHIDLIMGNSDSVKIYINEGNLNFKVETIPIPSDKLESIDIGDINSDGIYEIIVASYGKENYIFPLTSLLSP